MRQLNEAQQKLVADNHNLIYSLAHRKNINLEEHYGDLAFGLCKAALIYDSNKGKFSTLAFTVMYNEYKMNLRKKTTESVIPADMITSLETEIKNKSSEGFTKVENTIPDPDIDIENQTVVKFSNEEFASTLQENERLIFFWLLDGLKQCEIADQLKCSRQLVNVKVRKIRRKLHKYMKTEDDHEKH